MGRFVSERWLAIGSALSGLGGTSAVGYWIYVMKAPSERFWSLPGYIGVVILVLGFVTLLVGFFAPTSPSGPFQSQRAGDASTNVQAGGDIHIGSPDA